MCSKIGRRRPQKLRLRPVHSRSNRNPLDLIELSWMPRRQIMRQTSMRCIDSAVSLRLRPWAERTQGIPSVAKLATKLGETRASFLSI